MPTAKEHGRSVLGGIIPNRIDLLEEALRELSLDHFVDSVQQKLFQFLEYFYQQTDGILTSGALSDLLTRLRADPGRKALYEETYADLKSMSVDDVDFRWSLHELKEELNETKLKETLLNTMEILQTGLEQKGGTVLKGAEDAKEFLVDRISDLDSTMTTREAPHGNMRDEAKLITSEYEQTKKARAAGELAGIQFGIPELDGKVGGLQKGDLVLSAAYSNDGKTSLCIQLAWSAAIEQGKNVLFLSTETVNTVVRRRLIARHSMHPKFAEFNLPEGLNSKDLKMGSLSDEEEVLFQAVTKDFTDRSQGYGEVYIYQLPENSSMDQVRQILNDVQKEFHIDLVICDYLQLLRPSGNRNTDRESLSGVLKNAKQLAVAFNKGEGVPFVSPWQVNRAGWEDAIQYQRYTSKAMAETAEATNTPDIIVTILAPIENTDRRATLLTQVLKHRDGETADGISLNVDYATCTFSGRGTIDTYSSSSLIGVSAFDSLIS